MNSRIQILLDLIDRFLSQIIIIVFVAVLTLCLYVVYDAFCIHNETQVISGAAELVKNVPDDQRISELKRTNEDIKAWIKLDDTEIDYPITQTSNNQFYLTHDYKKEYSIAGSIFADYRSNLTTDNYSVIYGHNMNGNSMFGSLNQFRDGDYFSKHNSGRIYLEDGKNYSLQVLGFAVVEDSQNPLYDLDNNANGANETIINTVNSVAINKNTPADMPNTLLLLSTCYQHSSQRSVLLVGYNR